MKNLEQFNGNQCHTSETWSAKSLTEQIAHIEHELNDINKEILEFEKPTPQSYFSKVLHGFVGSDKPDRLTILYQKRHTHKVMLDKLKGNETGN